MQDDNAENLARIRSLADKKAQAEYESEGLQGAAVLGALIYLASNAVVLVFIYLTKAHPSLWVTFLTPIFLAIFASRWLNKRFKANKHKDKNNPRNF